MLLIHLGVLVQSAPDINDGRGGNRELKGGSFGLRNSVAFSRLEKARVASGQGGYRTAAVSCNWELLSHTLPRIKSSFWFLLLCDPLAED